MSATTIGNHPLSHMLHTNQPQLNGLHTTMNHPLNSTHMNHLPTPTSPNMSHLHMFHTITGNHPLKAT
jgi:hypothetical protein